MKQEDLEFLTKKLSSAHFFTHIDVDDWDKIILRKIFPKKNSAKIRGVEQGKWEHDNEYDFFISFPDLESKPMVAFLYQEGEGSHNITLLCSDKDLKLYQYKEVIGSDHFRTLKLQAMIIFAHNFLSGKYDKEDLISTEEKYINMKSHSY